VSGLTSWGVYVELVGNHCEGMIALRDLPGDHYKFDQERYVVAGQRTGRKIKLGADLTVKVRAVDMDKRTVDLALVAIGGQAATGAPLGQWKELERKREAAKAQERARRSKGKGKRR